MKKTLLCMFLLSLLLVPGVRAEEGMILISEVLTDPLGADTGQEFVELVNVSSLAVDISGWEIDADQLPYFTFPAGTIMEGQSVLTLYLRQTGTSTAEALYTGSFGSTNMGNSKGSVALFRAGGRDAAHLEDFLQWGEGQQTHATAAAETGLFDAALFLPLAQEGESYTRTCLEVSCFAASAPTPGLSLLTTPAETSGSGEVLPEDVPTEPEEAPPARLRLLYVAMNNPSGTADDIGLFVEDDGKGGTGALLEEYVVHVDAHRLPLDGVHAKTGDILHIALGSAPPRAIDPWVQVIRWPQLAGLVATSEQVELHHKGVLSDGVCWFRDPVAQDELVSMALFQQLLWSGTCLASAGIPSGGVYERQDMTKYAADAWSLPVAPQAPPPPVPPDVVIVPVLPGPPCTPNGSSVLISELLPNPEGNDSGNEWIELQNRTDADLTLCGVLIDDEEGGSAPFALDGYTLAPHGYLLLPDTTTKIVLGNTADRVRLLDASGTLLEEVLYETAPSGKSFSRIE